MFLENRILLSCSPRLVDLGSLWAMAKCLELFDFSPCAVLILRVREWDPERWKVQGC